MLKMIARPRGATPAEIAKAFGWATHTARGIISRITRDGNIEISRKWEPGRTGVVYRLVNRFTGAKDRTRLTKAQSAKLATRGGFKAPKVAK
jgi:predicted ArsR family transcriptional regulator